MCLYVVLGWANLGVCFQVIENLTLHVGGVGLIGYASIW